MIHDFTDLIESAQVVQRTSKTGNPYYMLVLTLEGNIQIQYLCQKGEDSIVKALLQATDKKA